MSTHSLLFKDGITGRNPKFKSVDQAAVNAIVQAALNVELFTIPLYLTSLYSLQGLHQITSSNNLYQGRFWPGMATTANPATANEKAFNAIFSIAIAEMLHLQIASNICSAVGVTPSFTSLALQNDQQGWVCYGADQTTIPHIIDFKDTIAPYNSFVVKLDAVNKQQINLFLAIEETEAQSEAIIQKDKKDKYFPSVPFAGWQESYTETDLPLFGSIGHMYWCLWEYLSIKYSDNTSLWDIVFKPASTQNDIFNGSPSPFQPEYPKMNTAFTDKDSSDEGLAKLMNMINGITDQGEGDGVVSKILARLKLEKLPNSATDPAQPEVEEIYQPDNAALQKNYPSYDDQGNQLPQSADADARSTYGKLDHYDTFSAVMEMLDGIVTWDTWHETNEWQPAMLEDSNPGPYNHQLPESKAIADALNNLKNHNTDANYKLLSHAAAGSIAGVTTVLNTYWSSKGTFPFPSMYGSGDRISICWAVFGKAPDLSLGMEKQQSGVLYNSCQGLNLSDHQAAEAACAPIAAFHSCRGSNSCMAQGGCGFVQSVNGGSGCGSKLAMVEATKMCSQANDKVASESGCGAPSFYSAPADNKCNTFGGCAVPISASQLFPAPKPTMTGFELYDFPNNTPTKLDSGLPPYTEGTPVHNIAWQAYCKVIESRGQKPPANPPAPSDIRLAFPPST